MSVVDQRSRVPVLDDAAMTRLKACLDRDEILAAYLIGSQARGSAGPLSDVDLAILHDPELDPAQRLELRLAIAAAAGAALATTEVDVVLLNAAPPLLATGRSGTASACSIAIRGRASASRSRP